MGRTQTDGRGVAFSTLEPEAVTARAVMCEVIALKWDMEVLDPEVGKSMGTVHEDNHRAR